MLESLEGKRGLVRVKPPLPALVGPVRQAHGHQQYAELRFGSVDSGAWRQGLCRGMASDGHSARSRSNSPETCDTAGLIELAFGPTIRELVEDFGGGTRSGRPIRAVQVGGPLGAYFPQSLLDTPLEYESMTRAKGMLGHGGIVVFDDTVDLARQARFAFTFCARESCGKCTPCRLGSTRGVETVDKVVAGVDRQKNLEVLRDLCEVMTDGSLCALGGLTPLPVLSALDHFAEDFARRRGAPRPSRRFDNGAVAGTRHRHADPDGRRERHADHRRAPRQRSARDVGDGRGGADRRTRFRSSARPTRSKPSAPAVCVSSRSTGRRGTPASCTTPAEEGMVVRTRTPRLEKLRRGVMELYISDHPLDCLTCSANGDCELQTQAGNVGLRDVRYGYDGRQPPRPARRQLEPLFHLRAVEMHRLLALRARLRGGAGDIRPDDPRARLRFEGFAGRDRLPVVGMRLVRRLRSGLSDGDAEREAGDREGDARAQRRHHMRLLRRRLRLQGRTQGRRGPAHGPLEGRQGQRRPFLRQGTLRLRLRHPPGPCAEADDPQADRGSVAGSVAGTRRSVTRRANSGASRRNTGATPSARFRPRAAPTRRCSWFRSSCAWASATTTSTPAPASAIRRPASACRKPMARRPERRTSSRSKRRTSSW